MLATTHANTSTIIAVAGGASTITTDASGIFGKIVARKFGLRSGEEVAGQLTISTDGDAEVWTRTFGETTSSTTIRRNTDDTLSERVGPIVLRFAVTDLVSNRSTTMTLTRINVCGVATGAHRLVTISAEIGAAVTTVDIRFRGSWLGRCAYRASSVNRKVMSR